VGRRGIVNYESRSSKREKGNKQSEKEFAKFKKKMNYLSSQLNLQSRQTLSGFVGCNHSESILPLKAVFSALGPLIVLIFLLSQEGHFLPKNILLII